MALMGLAWEAIFLHTAVDDTPPFKVVAYSKSQLIANSINHLPHSHTHTYTHTHTRTPTHTHTLIHTASLIAHILSRTTFTYKSLTVRSYTIIFVYASFPCALHLLF